MVGWYSFYCNYILILFLSSSREGEFVDRIKELPMKILTRGGGILNSTEKATTSFRRRTLRRRLLERLNNLIKLGTGAIEIKSDTD